MAAGRVPLELHLDAMASEERELWFDLPEPVPKWVHRLEIERAEELGAKLGGWLARSWDAYWKPAAER